MKNYFFGLVIGIIAVLAASSLNTPARVLAEGDQVHGDKGQGATYEWSSPNPEDIILESGDKVRGDEGEGYVNQEGPCPFIG